MPFGHDMPCRRDVPFGRDMPFGRDGLRPTNPNLQKDPHTAKPYAGLSVYLTFTPNLFPHRGHLAVCLPACLGRRRMERHLGQARKM